MIITVTLNPALDKTISVDMLNPGGLNRIKSVTLDAGGKGVNVAKMAAVLGVDCIATGFCGGTSGNELIAMLDVIGIKHDFVNINGNTRTNTKVLDGNYGITELNEAGVIVSEEEEKALEDKLLSYMAKDTVYVLAGSVHANAKPNYYHKLIKLLKSHGAYVLFDADGKAFENAIAAVPDFIKPNNEELAAYCGKTGMEKLEMYNACKRFIEKGTDFVALSMGASGAAFITANEAYFAPALSVKVSSTVGAGDSMVAAVACAKQLGLSIKDTAILAIACSAGAVTTEGTKPPDKELVEKLKKRVDLHPITF